MKDKAEMSTKTRGPERVFKVLYLFVIVATVVGAYAAGVFLASAKTSIDQMFAILIALGASVPTYVIARAVQEIETPSRS